MSKPKPNTELNDYLDLQLIESLAPAHRHLITKLLNSDSSHIDKFLTKIASNQIQMNHDMLSKMTSTLKHQMALPIQIIHQRQTLLIELYLLLSHNNHKFVVN